jgi:hypothetical protein
LKSVSSFGFPPLFVFGLCCRLLIAMFIWLRDFVTFKIRASFLFFRPHRVDAVLPPPP